MLYLNYIAYECDATLQKSIKMSLMYYIPHATSKCNVMLEYNVCNVSYIVFFFMFMIAMRSLIQCYLFMVIVIMSMRGIYDDIILP